MLPTRWMLVVGDLSSLRLRISAPRVFVENLLTRQGGSPATRQKNGGTVKGGKKSNWPENDLFVTGYKTWRGWWFFHKNQADVDDRYFDGYPRGFWRFFGLWCHFCSWEVLKGRRPFRWLSPRLWVMFNQSKKSWMAQYKTTNSHRPQCCIRWTTSLFKFLYYKLSFNYELVFVTTVSPINWSLFFRFNPAGLMYWTKI